MDEGSTNMSYCYKVALRQVASWDKDALLQLVSCIMDTLSRLARQYGCNNALDVLLLGYSDADGVLLNAHIKDVVSCYTEAFMLLVSCCLDTLSQSVSWYRDV